MAAVEVPQTLEYKGGQLNAAPVLEVENFTNWKKRFMCHIIGIEPQFENIISNGPYIPMAAGQRKPETQWTPEERKAANLDQRLKSLIMSVLPDDQMNSVINCLTAKSTWDDLILYHEGPSDVKESRVMDLKLCYNTFKFKEGESLTQTFTRYKALMNKLVNDGIKLSKVEINTGFINRLPKKWLAFYQSLRNINHVKESEIASLFGKLKYEENLINSIYDTNKEKTLVPATPLSTAFFSSSIVQDFQDSPDDEEDTRSSQEYMNDLEEEYQARSLLAKSKRFFKKGTQRFSSAKATDQTECHKCGKKGHFTRYCWSKTSVPSYQSPFNQNFSIHLSTNLNRGIPKTLKPSITKSSVIDDNEVTEVKALIALVGEERVFVGKESARNGEWIKISMKKVHTLLKIEDNDDRESFPTQKKKILGIDQLTKDTSSSGLKDPVFVKSLADKSEASITGSNKPKLSEAEDSTLSNHNTGKHPLPPLKKLTGVEPVSGPKTIKSILKSTSTFKAETLKGFIINEPSSAPASGTKSSSASKTNSALAGKLKNVKTEDDPPLAIYHTGQGESSSRSRPSRPAIPFPSCIHCGYNDHKSNDFVYYPICEICRSYDQDTYGHNRIISLRRGIKPRNPQHVTKNCETCGSNVHTISDHNDIEWFRKREALQAKKVESFKASKTKSSSAIRSKTPTKRSGSRLDTVYPSVGYEIRRIKLYSFVVFGECMHGYAISSLMDMAYWSSE
ncbi:retrovirus-related pol polyprotein from transposon TNT 1-94 [Tanacetum coccineum]